jgi:hypothetical protein
VISFLADKTSSLTAVLAGAVSANQPTFFVGSNVEGVPREEVGNLNSATAVTIAAAPAASAKSIDYIHICNTDTAAVVVTIAKMVGGTSYSMLTQTLQAGYALRMDASGIYQVTSS